MKRRVLAALLLAPALVLSACGSLGSLYTYRSFGLLYTHTVRPLSRHMEPVDVSAAGAAQGNMKQIQFQYVSILWDENAIGEIARKGGIEKIHFADLETRSYVLGIWTRHTVHVYGTAAPSPAAPPPETPAPAGAGREAVPEAP